jgi:RNA-directed DNA polymerase
MRIHRRTTLTLKDLARWLNPIVAGWMNFYGRFYRSALEPLLARVNTYVRRWAGNKDQKLRSYNAVLAWWSRLVARDPRLFVQWRCVRSWA